MSLGGDELEGKQNVRRGLAGERGCALGVPIALARPVQRRDELVPLERVAYHRRREAPVGASACYPPDAGCWVPQHFLYFRLLPQGQGSLRPTANPTLVGSGGFSNRSTSDISSS